MTQIERERIDRQRHAMYREYRLLAKFLSKRFRDIDSGELHLSGGIRQLYQKELEALFGTSTRWGKLQQDLNERQGGILKDLKKDFPYFTGTQIQVFSYLASGLPFFLIANLAGLSSENSVYVMKTKMRERITGTSCPRREEYLKLLER